MKIVNGEKIFETREEIYKEYFPIAYAKWQEWVKEKAKKFYDGTIFP